MAPREARRVDGARVCDSWHCRAHQVFRGGFTAVVARAIYCAVRCDESSDRLGGANRVMEAE